MVCKYRSTIWNKNKLRLIFSCLFRFKCADCGHRWTKKVHSTILFQCDSTLRKIECKLFGHICLVCKNNPTYHVATYTEPEIQDAVEFLRIELLQKLYPILFSPDHRQQLQFNQRGRPSPGYGPPQRYGPSQGYGPPQQYGPSQGYGPPQRYYNVDFANYCESCRRGDYCRLHRRN